MDNTLISRHSHTGPYDAAEWVLRSVRNLQRLQRIQEDAASNTDKDRHPKLEQCGASAIQLLNTNPKMLVQLAEQKLKVMPKSEYITSPWTIMLSEGVLRTTLLLMKQAVYELKDYIQQESNLKQNTSDTLNFQRNNLDVSRMLNHLLVQITGLVDRAFLLTGLPIHWSWVGNTLDGLLKWSRTADQDRERFLGNSFSDEQSGHVQKLIFNQTLDHNSTRLVSIGWSPADKLLIPDQLPLQYPTTSASQGFPVVRKSVDVLSFKEEQNDLEEFQKYLFKSHTLNNKNGPKPAVIQDGLANWRDAKRWQTPAHLLEQTIGGRRLVPIEIGRSYVDADFTQRIMTFREFVVTCMLPRTLPARKRGYLAQHDFLSQIRSIGEEVPTPDMCHTDPPVPAHVKNMFAPEVIADAESVDSVVRNFWMGPAYTESPIHHDPHHNILLQVVGYKYVRLYAPDEAEKLYLRGRESGISMANTSRVDAADGMRAYEGWSRWDDADGKEGKYDAKILRDKLDEAFPLFKSATYVEHILAPGEMLYIPFGWFHYVRSLSSSISINFWWN